MPLFERLFGGRIRRATEQYVRALMEEPEQDEIDWLAEVATTGDHDRARWELRYLRRAVGLLVAQRDALDDRTGSSVARQLTETMAADRHVAAPMIRIADRQFNERLSAYREMLGMRGSHEGSAERLGRTLLLLAGAARLGAEELARAAELTDRHMAYANARLLDAFGGATLSGGGPAQPG